ncbi:hypothetical protein PMAYCL1PPCAC_07446, partial [Pristionchus mayeri]
EMGEVGVVKKTKKKLKVKKKVVGATSSGTELTIKVKEERKKVSDEEIREGLEQHEVSTFDLVSFDANEESEGIDALKLEDSAEDDDDDEVAVAPSPTPKPIVKKEKKSVRFDPSEVKEEPENVEKKEDKKLKKIKDLVKEDHDSDKTVFASLDDLKSQLSRFKHEQHLRRWMKKLLLTKRITTALRNEACDYWKETMGGEDEVAQGSQLTREETEALVQMEGTFEQVKKSVNALQREGRVSRKECGAILKKWKARERRRVTRQMQHAPVNLECFNCRQRGHVFADCPEKKKKLDEGTGICFKCGSMEHAIYKCPKKDKIKGFPHATCFICGARGHLSKECEKNEHGIYIDGGSCDLCGSKMHLRKNCDKQALKEQNEKEKANESMETGGGEDEEELKPRGIKRPAVKKEEADEEAKKDKSRVLSSKKWGKKAEDGGDSATSTTVTRPVATGTDIHQGGDDDDFQFLAGEDGDEPFKPSDNEEGPPHKKMKMFGGRGRGGGGFRGRGDRGGGGFRGRGRGGYGGFRGRGGGMRDGGRGRGGFRGGDGGRGRGGGGFRG